MSQFVKPSIPVEEQIDTLLARGLIISDRAKAEHYLNNINYYRLSAYTRVFYKSNTAHHEFVENTTFDT
jgi:abortive infection bacteriophage resistance protein